MPLIRVSQSCLEHIDRNVRDYSCVLVKQERINGDLGEQQIIRMKLRHEPFSVAMTFNKPHAGREVLYVHGRNENNLLVREAGLLRIAGFVSLDPQGSRAMAEQKHPITMVGIRNLLSEIVRECEGDTKFAESEVTVNPAAKVSERPATLVKIVHPIPRQNFRAHITRIYFDNELRIPIHYDSWMWPEQEGAQPPLAESFTYAELKTNNGFTDRDFAAGAN
jgi:hypothetical protein